MSWPNNLVNTVNTLVNKPRLDWQFNSSFSSADWLEAVNLYSPTQLSMGRKRSHATITAYVPFSKLQDCILWLLGFSWVDNNGLLRRLIPVNHPLFNNMWASEIQECVGVKFITKLPITSVYSLPYAGYNLARLTVAYTQPPFDVLLDNQLAGFDLTLPNMVAYRGQETRRWTYWAPKPYVDLLDVPAGVEKFNAPGKAWDTAKVQSSKLVVRAQKSTKKLIWKDVPVEFVCDNYGFLKKIENRIGTINSDPFFGDSTTIHTWMLDDVDLINQEVYADPLASQAFAAVNRRMDLVFTFKHFDPPRGYPGNPERGWRLRPAWQDGMWYPVTRVDGGTTFPDERDFSMMFTSVQFDPDP